MTLRPGWPAVSGAATFLDIRQTRAGEFARNAAGALRSGILPAHANALVTSKATMAVDVAAFVAVIDRNGAVGVANDGTVAVTISAAPASGSRWSVVYVKQRESAAPMSDGADGPILDKVESTTSEATARGLLPVGSLELAVVQVPAGASATNSGGVIITQTAPYTAAAGGVVWIRNATEQAAWTPAAGSVAYRIDTGKPVDRVGSAWVSRGASVRVRTSTGHTTSGSVFTPSAIAWNLADVDTDGFHDNVTNPSRLTAPTDGTYMVSAKIRSTSTAFGSGIQLGVNGTFDAATRVFETPMVGGGAGATPQVTAIFALTAGQYVEVFSLGEAASLALSVADCFAFMHRIG